MAHTKSSGAAKNTRDSRPKYLGVKKYDGELVKPGQILIRQRGSKYLAGSGVKMGKDYTIYALQSGLVKFTNGKKTRFDRTRRYIKIINVLKSG